MEGILATDERGWTRMKAPDVRAGYRPTTPARGLLALA